MFVTSGSNGTTLYVGGQGVAGLNLNQPFAVHLAVGATIGFTYSGAAPLGWLWLGD
jgi:hypothetical protein